MVLHHWRVQLLALDSCLVRVSTSAAASRRSVKKAGITLAIRKKHASVCYYFWLFMTLLFLVALCSAAGQHLHQRMTGKEKPALGGLCGVVGQCL